MRLGKLRAFSILAMRVHISLENLVFTLALTRSGGVSQSIQICSWHLESNKGPLWEAKSRMMLPLKEFGCQSYTRDCSSVYPDQHLQS